MTRRPQLLTMILGAAASAVVHASSPRPQNDAPQAASTQELEAKYHEATGILDDLLFPNSMVRTEPRSDTETLLLLDKFYTVASFFSAHPTESIEFLAAKLVPAETPSQDAGYCSLQLLWAVGGEAARDVIQNAQRSPDEVVSRTAREMVSEGRHLLWGFQHLRKEAK